MNKYTVEHGVFITEKYGTMTRADLVNEFNKRFDIKLTIGKLKNFLSNRKISLGENSGRFQKGHKPWNTGSKGLSLTGPNSGTFKKGSVPPNRKPLWSERSDPDGYTWMKVPEEDPYTGFPTRYKLKHKWIYEQKYGPVPKGHIVIFKDQNKRNFDPENLEAIKRADLARLNQAGYKKAPGELKPSIMALCRLKTKIGEARRKSMGTKICSKCKREKELEKDFHKSKTSADGRKSMCKKCTSEYMAGLKTGKDGKGKKKKAISPEIVTSGTSALSLDIARLESENSVSMKEAAKFVIASVEKKLLGAIFEELRR